MINFEPDFVDPIPVFSIKYQAYPDDKETLDAKILRWIAPLVIHHYDENYCGPQIVVNHYVELEPDELEFSLNLLRDYLVKSIFIDPEKKKYILRGRTYNMLPRLFDYLEPRNSEFTTYVYIP